MGGVSQQVLGGGAMAKRHPSVCARVCVCVCMYVCVCMCMHVCVCVCVHVCA